MAAAPWMYNITQLLASIFAGMRYMYNASLNVNIKQQSLDLQKQSKQDAPGEQKL